MREKNEMKRIPKLAIFFIVLFAAATAPVLILSLVLELSYDALLLEGLVLFICGSIWLILWRNVVVNKMVTAMTKKEYDEVIRLAKRLRGFMGNAHGESNLSTYIAVAYFEKGEDETFLAWLEDSRPKASYFKWFWRYAYAFIKDDKQAMAEALTAFRACEEPKSALFNTAYKQYQTVLDLYEALARKEGGMSALTELLTRSGSPRLVNFLLLKKKELENEGNR